MTLIFRLLAILLLALGLLCAVDWISIHSDGVNAPLAFLIAGLLSWCLSDTIPLAVTRRQT